MSLHHRINALERRMPIPEKRMIVLQESNSPKGVRIPPDYDKVYSDEDEACNLACGGNHENVLFVIVADFTPLDTDV